MQVLKNYLYNVVYQLFVIVVPVITMPYVTRVIGPKGIGINTFTNSIIQYFILLGTIGLTMYGSRQIAYTRNDKVRMTKTFLEIEFLLCITTFFSYLLFFLYLMFIDSFRIYYLAQSISVIAIAFDISWFFMGVENFRVTVLRNVFIKLVFIALVFFVVKDENDLLKYILINSLSVLFGNLTFWPYLRRYLTRVKFKDLNILPHLKPSLLLFLPQIATNIYVILNKTMLGMFDNVEASGYFDNSDKILKITLAVLTSLATVMMPRVANTFATGNKDKVADYLNKSLNFTLLIAVPMMFGIAAIGEKFAPWFLGDKFQIVGRVLQFEAPAILAISIASVLGNQYLLPTNHNRQYTISTILGAVTNLIINIPLIIYFGAIGTAVATVISEICVTLAQMFFVKKELDLKNLFSDFWKYFFCGLIMYVVVKVLNTILSFSFLVLLIEFLVGLIVYITMIFFMRPKIVQWLQMFINQIVHFRGK